MASDTLPVAQQLAAESAKVSVFLAAVGEDVLSRSVVGQDSLRDIWALRFLVGFKWQPLLAAEKFKTMVEYRVQFGIDNIRRRMQDGELVPSSFPGYSEHHAAYVHSTFDLGVSARGGNPVAIECPPRFHHDALLAIDGHTQDTYLMHVMEWSFLQLDRASIKSGDSIGYVKIFDCDGCTMKHCGLIRPWAQACSDRSKRLGFNIDECYPEWFSKVFVVNSPSFFTVIWKMIKPFLPARTAEKVEVLSNRAKAKDRMLKTIDPKALPAFLGGDFVGEWRMELDRSSPRNVDMAAMSHVQ